MAHILGVILRLVFELVIMSYEFVHLQMPSLEAEVLPVGGMGSSMGGAPPQQASKVSG